MATVDQNLGIFLATSAGMMKDHRLPNTLEQLRGIVLSDEASITSMEETRQALTVSLPEFQNQPSHVNGPASRRRIRRSTASLPDHTDPSFLGPTTSDYNPDMASQDFQTENFHTIHPLSNFCRSLVCVSIHQARGHQNCF